MGRMVGRKPLVPAGPGGFYAGQIFVIFWANAAFNIHRLSTHPSPIVRGGVGVA